jgi:hypothetical protein
MKSWVFSYGSLVNEKTEQTLGDSVLVALDGWRREWSHVIELPHVLIRGLTITKSRNTRIHGRLIAVGKVELDTLDTRESGYSRFLIRSHVGAIGNASRDGLSLNNRIYAYRSQQAEELSLGEPPCILQTYIDVILDGYFRNFGEEGAVEFMRTTIGWDQNILNDRSDPIYPRAQDLDEDFLRWVDQMVQRFRS